MKCVFCRGESKTTIVCQSITGLNDMLLDFETKERKEKFKADYCNGNCAGCVAYELHKSKYE